MVSKDQSIGGAIFIVCAVVGILYFITLVWPGPIWFSVFGMAVDEDFAAIVRFWAVAVPVLIAFIAVTGIGAWIGWTMATTPPPKPIEEFTSEAEEKKEATPEPLKAEEEKKSERKRKEEK